MKIRWSLGALLLAVSALGASSARAQQWVLQKPTVVGEQVYGAEFGDSVAIADDFVVVGAPLASFEDVGNAAGYVTLFRTAEGATGKGTALYPIERAAGVNFGWVVAASSSIIAVGAPFSVAGQGDKLGRVHLFDPVTALEKLPALEEEGETGGVFGWAVAASEKRVVVGAPFGAASGAAYVYEPLVRQDGAISWPGKPLLPPPGIGTEWGSSVAIDADTIVVGDSTNSTAGELAGAVYVFDRSPEGQWTRYPDPIVAKAPVLGANLGFKVAISGDVIVATASITHSCHVFKREAGTWSEAPFSPLETPPEAAGTFGAGLAITSVIAWIGADDYRDRGAVFPFALSDGVALPPLFPGEAAGERFGYSVAARGGTVAVGVPYGNDSTGDVLIYSAPAGADCGSDSECDTKHCAQGVCCTSACSGPCESCLAGDKSGGVTGACGPVAANRPGRDAGCQPSVPPPCQETGLCDGAGSCSFFGPETSCGSPSCAGPGQERGLGRCDGLGHCPPGEVRDCQGSICDAAKGACQDGCGTDTDCIAEHFCTGETCSQQIAEGAVCSRDGECLSGHCVDGVCCENACGGQCEACAEKGLAGHCVAVSGAPRRPRQACGQSLAGNDCSELACDGQNVKKCVEVNQPGARCRPASCNDGLAVDEGRCTEDGLCEPPNVTDCGSFACGPQACLDQCENDGDCVSPAYCAAGACRTEPRCSDDGSTALNQAGTKPTKPCSPAVCRDGACVERCESDSDCDAAHACSTAFKCEPRSVPSPHKPDVGCGCRAAPQPSAPTIWLALSMLLLGAKRRHSTRRSVNKNYSGST